MVEITYDRYKNRRAVCLDTGTLTALFLPDDGAKLASLKDSAGREFIVQAPGEKYLVLTRDGRYGSAECAGFDDMFPTIDAYIPPEGAQYPDHGEICRMSAETTVGDGYVSFRFISAAFRTVYTKTVTGEGCALRLSYRIENRCDKPFPYIWAAHCMLCGEDSAYIVSPYTENAPIRKMFGRTGEDRLSRTRLSGYDRENGDAYKFYYTDRIPDGFCGYAYPDRGETFMMRYDREKLPYLGIWMNNGSSKGLYNVAPEICTAPFDAPGEAMKTGYCSVIPANGEVRFEISVGIEKLDQGEK